MATAGLMLGTVLGVVAMWLVPHAAASSDIQLQLGPYFFNPSVVEYKGVYVATARSSFMKGVAGRWWWFNEAYICQASDARFTSPSCTHLDPWAGKFKECLWSGLVDTRGPEDAKLFVFPGRGLFAMVNRKPSRASAGRDGVCRKDEPWLLPYLFPVVLEPGAGKWAQPQWPVPLKLDIPSFYFEQQSKKQIIKEKNYMPFVYQEQLFMVHSIHPSHRVLLIQPDGVATQQFVSDSKPLLGAKFDGQEVHGGPPVVYVPPELATATTMRSSNSTGSSSNYYLAVLHYYTWDKTNGRDVKEYHHYFYKFRPAPPFTVCAVSSEIPLVFKDNRTGQLPDGGKKLRQGKDQIKSQRIWKDTTQTAFVNGLFLKVPQAHGASGELPAAPAAGPRLLVSYGSSDVDARLLVMTLPQLEAMFDTPHDCRVTPSMTAEQ